MPTKLTLSIDEEVIRKAKKVSQREGKSLSRIVEDYLRSVGERQENQGSAIDKIHLLLEGKITHPKVDWKKVKHQSIRRKYGI